MPDSHALLTSDWKQGTWPEGFYAVLHVNLATVFLVGSTLNVELATFSHVPFLLETATYSSLVYTWVHPKQGWIQGLGAKSFIEQRQ